MGEADEKAKLNEERWDLWAERYDRCFSFTRWTQKRLVFLLELGENPTFWTSLAALVGPYDMQPAWLMGGESSMALIFHPK